MKTKIYISGQIGGNFELRSAIITSECQETRTRFGGFCLEFPTKKAAEKALWEGYKILRRKHIDSIKENRNLLTYSAKSAIYYDASEATISDNQSFS